jgi:hypothetical protein
MRNKYFTINRYIHDVSVDKAKKRFLPHVRGTILPSWDWQINNGGIAINWLWIRVRLIF